MYKPFTFKIEGSMYHVFATRNHFTIFSTKNSSTFIGSGRTYLEALQKLNNIKDN